MLLTLVLPKSRLCPSCSCYSDIGYVAARSPTCPPSEPLCLPPLLYPLLTPLLAPLQNGDQLKPDLVAGSLFISSLRSWLRCKCA